MGTGSECRFSCMKGCRNFTNPLPVLTCTEAGVWNPAPPPANFTCIANDCPELSIANGFGCGPTPVGKFCTFSCNPGYQLSGQPAIECLFKYSDVGFECDRTWQTAILPTCTPITCSASALVPPANGFLENCYNVGVNQDCRVVCSPGFILVPNSPVLTCTYRGWSPHVLPQCQQIRCPELYPTPNLMFVNPDNCR